MVSHTPCAITFGVCACNSFAVFKTAFGFWRGSMNLEFFVPHGIYIVYHEQITNNNNVTSFLSQNVRSRGNITCQHQNHHGCSHKGQRLYIDMGVSNSKPQHRSDAPGKDVKLDQAAVCPIDAAAKSDDALDDASEEDDNESGGSTVDIKTQQAAISVTSGTTSDAEASNDDGEISDNDSGMDDDTPCNDESKSTDEKTKRDDALLRNVCSRMRVEDNGLHIDEFRIEVLRYDDNTAQTKDVSTISTVGQQQGQEAQISTYDMIMARSDGKRQERCPCVIAEPGQQFGVRITWRKRLRVHAEYERYPARCVSMYIDGQHVRNWRPVLEHRGDSYIFDAHYSKSFDAQSAFWFASSSSSHSAVPATSSVVLSVEDPSGSIERGPDFLSIGTIRIVIQRCFIVPEIEVFESRKENSSNQHADDWQNVVLPAGKKFTDHGALAACLGEPKRQQAREQMQRCYRETEPVTVAFLHYDTAATLELRRQMNSRIKKHAALLGDDAKTGEDAADDVADPAAACRTTSNGTDSTSSSAFGLQSACVMSLSNRIEKRKRRDSSSLLDEHMLYACDLTEDDVVKWTESKKRRISSLVSSSCDVEEVA